MEQINAIHVNDYNYDVAVVAATDRQGNGRLGWADYGAGKACVSKKEYKFIAGPNSEHQSGAMTLLASRLAYLCQNQDIANKNILLVVSDSVAPRVFEAKKVINQMAGESSEAVAEAITEKIIKSWMPQAWIDALGNFALAMAAAVCDCKANVDAIKKSELHERTLVDCFDVKEGDKVTVLKGGFIEGHEGARTSGYVKPGEYTVIDRSYETKDGEVIPQFNISRWENTKATGMPLTLMKLNSEVSASLPNTSKELEIEFVA